MHRFGLYPWVEEHGTQLVHEVDLHDWRALMPYGKVFELRGQADEFLELGYGARTFRVRPDMWREVQGVAFGVGDKVTVLNGEAGGEMVIREALWHFEREQVFYLLWKQGRASTRRYFQAEVRAT